MSESKDERSDAERAIIGQMPFYKATVLVILLAVLMLSAAFCLFLARENAILRQTRALHARCVERLEVMREVHDYTRHLVGELDKLAKTDEALKELLDKQERALWHYGLRGYAGGPAEMPEGPPK